MLNAYGVMTRILPPKFSRMAAMLACDRLSRRQGIVALKQSARYFVASKTLRKTSG